MITTTMTISQTS